MSTVSANYEHHWTFLGWFKNIPIALGGWIPDNKKVKSLQFGHWIEIGEFPFVESSIYSFSFVNFDDTLFLFGKNLI